MPKKAETKVATPVAAPAKSGGKGKVYPLFCRFSSCGTFSFFFFFPLAFFVLGIQFVALFFPPFLSQIIGMLETIATSSWESVGQVSVHPGIREQSFIGMSED